MPDFEVSPEQLDGAAATVGAEAGTVGNLASHIAPPSSHACGELLANAFSITFPAATDQARDFVTSMSEAIDSISTRLTASATLYRQAEEDAITAANSIWDD